MYEITPTGILIFRNPYNPHVMYEVWGVGESGLAYGGGCRVHGFKYQKKDGIWRAILA